jgi:D-alanyl-D-alanine carboxypeptidase (penicillin-binding protein 5/6)
MPVSANADKMVQGEILFELSSGTVLYSKNADTPLPVGVLNKLMTVLAAADAVTHGSLHPEDVVKAPSSVTVKGASVWLEPGDEITVDELFRSVIIGNANDAAVTLAYAVNRDPAGYEKKVSEISEKLDLTATSFTNVHGHTEPEKQLSSADDIAKMLTALSQYGFLADYFATNLDYVRGGTAQLVNSNRLVRFYDGTIGYKYGYSKESGYCIAAAAERGGNRYGVVVLGFDDEDAIYSRAKALLNNGFNAYTAVMPEIPRDLPAEISVKGSFSETIPISAAEPQKLIIRKGETGFEPVICLPEYILAPVQNGDRIGEIHYYLGGKVIYRLGIHAGTDADKLGFPDHLKLLLENIFSFS